MSVQRRLHYSTTTRSPWPCSRVRLRMRLLRRGTPRDLSCRSAWPRLGIALLGRRANSRDAWSTPAVSSETGRTLTYLARHCCGRRHTKPRHVLDPSATYAATRAERARSRGLPRTPSHMSAGLRRPAWKRLNTGSMTPRRASPTRGICMLLRRRLHRECGPAGTLPQGLLLRVEPLHHRDQAGKEPFLSQSLTKEPARGRRKHNLEVEAEHGRGNPNLRRGGGENSRARAHLSITLVLRSRCATNPRCAPCASALAILRIETADAEATA